MEIYIIIAVFIIGVSAFFIGREYSRRKQAEKDGVELNIVGKNMHPVAKAILLILSFAFLAFAIYYFITNMY